MARKPQAREAKIGDNSAMNADERKKLDGYVRSIVTLENEKKETVGDIKGLYESVKDANFSVKAVRRLVKAKMMTQAQKLEEKSLADLTETYMHALGMLADTPLGASAVSRDLGGEQVDLEDAIAAAGNGADISNPPFKPADDVLLNPRT